MSIKKIHVIKRTTFLPFLDQFRMDNRENNPIRTTLLAAPKNISCTEEWTIKRLQLSEYVGDKRLEQPIS